MKQRFGLFIAMFVTLGAAEPNIPTAANGQTAWQEFSFREGGYSVLLPCKPIPQIQKVDTKRGKVDTHIALCEVGDGISYFTAYADFPIVITDATAINRILDGGRDSILAGGERKLLSETPIGFSGTQGRELILRGPEGSRVARVYWVKRRLYQLIAITPANKSARDDVTRFLTSFKLTNDADSGSAWIEVSSEKGGFSIIMPATPSEQTMPVEAEGITVNAYVYLSLGRDGIAYFAVYFELPAVPSDHTQVIRTLDGVRNGQLDKSKGKLLSEVTIEINGYPGRELNISTPAGLALVRIYLVKQRLYQVFAVLPEGVAGVETARKDAARFLSSFKLTTR